MLINKYTVGEVSTNCYILADEATNQASIIDPGGNGDEIINFISEKGYKVLYIILTHGHFDHILDLQKIKEKTNAKIAIGENEKDFLEKTELNLAHHLGHKWNAINADILLKDGDILSLGNSKLEIIETPGHTKGGICVLSENNLFSGDTIFKADIGRCDLPTGNLKQLIDSINKKLMVLDESILVYPGHGENTTIKYEKRNNYYVRRNIDES